MNKKVQKSRLCGCIIVPSSNEIAARDRANSTLFFQSDKDAKEL